MVDSGAKIFESRYLKPTNLKKGVQNPGSLLLCNWSLKGLHISCIHKVWSLGCRHSQPCHVIVIPYVSCQLPTNKVVGEAGGKSEVTSAPQLFCPPLDILLFIVRKDLWNDDLLVLYMYEAEWWNISPFLKINQNWNESSC